MQRTEAKQQQLPKETNQFPGRSSVSHDDPPPPDHYPTILFQRTTDTDSSCKLTGIRPWVKSLNNIYSTLTNILYVVK